MESFQWLRDLFTTTDSVAHIALLYAMVIAVGVYLGKIKIGGVSLGVTFVLFAGIVAGHIGFTAPIPILTFVQDFGDNYCMCEFGCKTFIEENGFHYIENHHLVEKNLIEKNKNIKDIDKLINDKNNLFKLCPMCHRKIHHANTKQKKTDGLY